MSGATDYDVALGAGPADTQEVAAARLLAELERLGTRAEIAGLPPPSSLSVPSPRRA